MPNPNQRIIDLLKRVDREGAVVLPSIPLSQVEGELIGNAVSVSPYEPLMHYMKLEFFMGMLQSSDLWMRRLDTFEDDPHEGKYPAANDHQMSAFDTDLFAQIGATQSLAEMRASNDIQRQFVFIHCWFGDVFESKSMWEKYGDQGRGVCLRSTPSRLREAVRRTSDLGISMSKVTYLDEDVPIPTAMSFLPLCRKRKQFSSEKEFRLIAQIPPEALPTDKDGFLITPDRYRKVSVSLDRLLEAVVAGPNLGPDDLESLQNAVGTKVSGKIVRLSEIKCWQG